jgi:hypothetical protein
MDLVQVTRRRGRVDRVPAGQMPVVELYLEPNQTVVSIEFSDGNGATRDRKTVDWHWQAYIATRAAGPSS